jgi:release factor glutamine methyltransferase
MTIEEILTIGRIEDLDREVLLAAALGQSRAWLMAHKDEFIADKERGRFFVMVERRQRGEPVAYILGEKDFYGRTFHTPNGVLIPRPATEELTSLAMRMLRGERLEKTTEIDEGIVAWSEWKEEPMPLKLAVDVGTGTGCIAVTLACEMPEISVIATDVPKMAIETAQKNAERHNVADKVNIRRGQWLEPVHELTEPFLLVSNPPYIPAGTELAWDVEGYEPHDALFSGEDGASMLRILIDAAREHAFCKGFIIECRKEQAGY